MGISYNNFLIFKTLLFLAGFSVLHSQNVQLGGNVIDTVKNSIPHANLIATPLVDNLNITFATTDSKGQYKLNLMRSVPYRIEISHLGFSKLTDTVNINQDMKKTYTLYERSELLEQVVINQKAAILVKEDTITFRTNQFRTGGERKLREVLKRLPGVEVDREGNVKVNGKKVVKLMVEGKTFFTGDAKLAVNNIPADAVDEIVALDNYSEIAFLKGLNNSNKMALNIKLNKDKKKFAFGDLESGGGVKERFLIHPTLFYYHPKTAVNVIGDINNVGKKSFTLKDYINFEGGFVSLLEESTSFADLYNSEFMQFLNQKDFTFQKNDFAAGSVSQQFSPLLRLEAFSILNNGITDVKNVSSINYLTDGSLDETRKIFNRNNMFFTLNKFKLRYELDEETNLSYDASVKTSKGDALSNVISFVSEDNTTTNTFQQVKNISVNQKIRYDKQFSNEHVSTAVVNYSYNVQENDRDWLFDHPIFNNLIPLEGEDVFFNILQNTSTTKHHAILGFKHYWILDKFNHICPRVGFRFLDESFSSLDSQLLQNGNLNDFIENDFNNDTNFRLNENYIGVQYKVKLGNFIVKPSLMYHFYFWKVNQFAKEITNKQKSVLLPELNMKYELSSVEKIEFDYQLQAGFSNVQQYANRLRLIDFNQLYRGNENLDNQLYHKASLNYSQLNFFKGVYISAILSYTKREKSIRSAIQIEGIDQVKTSVYTSLPENSYNFVGSFGKQLGDYKLTLLGNFNLADYTRAVNYSFINYKSKNLGYTLKVETRFKDWPNFEIGCELKKSSSESENSEIKFIQKIPYAIVEWDFLNDFILSVDYYYNYYKNLNINQINQFNVGSLSLYYNKEDNPWGFEIDVNNIFDVRYKNKNTFNQFLVMDTNIFIQPRIILFKLSYKL